MMGDENKIDGTKQAATGSAGSTPPTAPSQVDETSVSEEKVKMQKMLPAQKLPKLFKKTYTEKALEKKILKKIYIDEDRELVKSIFTERITQDKKGRVLKTPKVAVSLQKEYPYGDVKSLKLIAKAVKKNRGRFRAVPFAVVVGVCALIVLVVSIFINPIAKRGLKYALESTFGAKTDVGYVNVKLLGINVTVGSLAVGDKDSAEYDYTKNLFELEKLTVSFNLTQALRGKFIAENLDVTGIQFGTDRATSCYLPAAEKKEEKEADDSEFMKELKARSTAAVEDLRQQANDMLGGSDVNEIVSNLMKQLKTPAVAGEAETLAKTLSEKWQGKPAEFQEQKEKFQAEFQKYQTMDMGEFQGHPEKVAAAVAEITKTVNAVNELKAGVEETVASVKTDVEGAQAFVASVTEAAKADHELVTGKLNTVASAVTNAKSLFNSALETIAYNLLGKYYPYVKKGIGYAEQMKANAQANSAASGESAGRAKSTAKGVTGRLSGTTIPFSRAYPTFWIKNVSASGYTDKAGGKGFSGRVQNVTSDQDVAGSATSAQVSFDLSSTNHAASLVLDARSASTAPLISVDYAGKGFAAQFDGTAIAKSHGVPSVSGGAALSLKGTAGSDGFSASGEVGLSSLVLTSDGFPNEMVTKYYNEALAAVKDLSLGYEVSYAESKGIVMSLLGDFADVFASALKAAVLSFASDAKDKALSEMNKYIDEHLGEGLGPLKSFISFSSDFDIQNMNVDSLQKMMQDKIAEIQAAGTAVANEAATQAVNEALKNISGASSADSKSKLPISIPGLGSGKSSGSGESSDAAASSGTDNAEEGEKSSLTDTEKNDKAKEAISSGLKSLFGR